MPYYIYNNWARNRGRVHKAECSACNHGKGFQQTDSGRNGEWLGPYEDRATAFLTANNLGRTEMSPCKWCNP